MMRIAIAWPGFTGYMAPCFQALSKRCELRVYIEASHYEQQFDGSGMEELHWRRIEDASARAAVVEELRDWTPDLVLVCGWSTPLAKLLAKAKLPGRKVLAFDMPWEWTLRKFAARWLLRPRLRSFDAAFVPGNRCARYARWLGFTDKRLVLGSNPSGWERFGEAREGREGKIGVGVGVGFLYVGRFSEEKGLGVLLRAYERYRAKTSEPWELDLVGSGTALPKKHPEGVRCLGFVKPTEMPRVMSEHACLVLPSRWEPWGVSAAEAMSARRMTILSERCGITDDVQATCVVPYGDVEALSAALAQVARMDDDARSTEGQRACAQMECYSAANWAARVLKLGGAS